MFLHFYDFMLKDSHGCFNALLTPLNQPVGAASDQQLVQFLIFFPLGQHTRRVTLVSTDSFADIFTLQLTFHITAVLEMS